MGNIKTYAVFSLVIGILGSIAGCISICLFSGWYILLGIVVLGLGVYNSLAIYWIMCAIDDILNCTAKNKANIDAANRKGESLKDLEQKNFEELKKQLQLLEKQQAELLKSVSRPPIVSSGESESLAPRQSSRQTTPNVQVIICSECGKRIPSFVTYCPLCGAKTR